MMGCTRNSRNDERNIVAAYGSVAATRAVLLRNESGFLLNVTDFKVFPISAGLRVTLIPHSSITASFSCAVPLPPEMMAPAWPMRLPGGAVIPAMKPTTGFFMLSLTHCAASPRPSRRSRPP